MRTTLGETIYFVGDSMADSEFERITESSVSRRTMLKRTGLGAAAIWAAPAIVSVTSASAASPQGCNSDCAKQAICDFQVNCDTQCDCWFSAAGTGKCCVTSVFCNPGAFCTGPDLLDCPPGYLCVSNCCGNICRAPCGSALPPLGLASSAVTGSPNL